MKTKPFSELLEQLTPERRAKIETHVQLALLHHNLLELQESLGITQEDMKKNHNVVELALSEWENHDDIQVSTLSGYIKALGGSLKLVAHFPDKEVVNKEKKMWEIEYTDEFEQWWLTLDAATQTSIDTVVKLLEKRGPNLGDPYSSDIKGSRHTNLRELRIQHKGDPIRILYAFDPRRVAVLLIGGNKKGNDRWYEENVPKADRLYHELLQELEDEGSI